MFFFNRPKKKVAFYLLLLFPLLKACTQTPRPQPTLLQAPEENRFSKIVLAENLREPMELAVSGEEVFFIERKGSLHRYDPSTGQTKEIGRLNVFSGNNDGLLGLALDPDFKTKQHIYLYYSPAGDVPKQHLSRFTLRDHELDIRSEKVILQIPTQREQCCHSAGSLTFGPDGVLWVAVGDNVSPRVQEGYTPIDERPGRSAFDAQGTSANTNDLRGKILRIKPQPDGSYTIPKGNLFRPGQPLTRPEIYVMGARNPFRISVNPKTNYLYFGDIGPDANVDSEKGPRAYDEVNLAKNPGNYGWPYFVGPNLAYPKRDFATEALGEKNNPQKPLNHSPNNTGLKELPPARKPMIWYSYDESEGFPLMGKGGRSAMAAEVYNFDPELISPVKFPAYFDNTLFIYEWMRNRILTVKLDRDGNYNGMERFMPSALFEKPMDMQFGPDGALYVLEYGSSWYSDNPDARLSRIEFTAGNRPPVAVAKASATAGSLPHPVKFSSDGTYDYDGDALSYRWLLRTQNQIMAELTGPAPEFTFEKPGVYTAQLTVTDAQGAESTASVEVVAGNTPPQISILLPGNKTFYWENQPLPYKVQVTDHEDGTVTGGGIDTSRVFVFVDYATGDNLSPVITGHQEAMAEALPHPGKALIDANDCRGCHQLDRSSIGPSYREVALRYQNDASASERLAQKIIKGGSGVWTKNFVMVAHPELSPEQAKTMVAYILSTADEKEQPRRLPLSGHLRLTEPAGSSTGGYYRLTAHYTDRGGEKVGPLKQEEWVKLRSPKIQAEDFDHSHKVEVKGKPEDGANRFVSSVFPGSYLVFEQIDLTDVAAITYQYASAGAGGTVELRLGSAQDPVVSTALLKKTGEAQNWQQVRAPVKKNSGKHDLYLVFSGTGPEDKDLFNLNWINFEPAAPQPAPPKPSGKARR